MKNRGTYFKTDNQFWTYIRSQLRRVWSKHPTKLDFLKSIRFSKKIGNRTQFFITCQMCKQDHVLKKIEVNHKVKCGDVRDPLYVSRLLDVSIDDLEALCKDCHGLVTYAERYNLSIEEATIEKQVVAFSKLTAKEQLLLVDGKNANERKDNYRKLLKEKPDE